VYRMLCFQLTMLFFWVVTPCGFIGRYQTFRETSYYKNKLQVGGRITY
jgi:hypothetical protein